MIIRHSTTTTVIFGFLFYLFNNPTDYNASFALRRLSSGVPPDNEWQFLHSEEQFDEQSGYNLKK